MGKSLTIADFPHCAAGLQYARDVVEGRILACHWVRQACQRHLDDLKTAKKRKLDFIYEPAERVCRFMELLPHIKGRWAKKRQLIELEPWQKFILTSVFGWHREDPQNPGAWVRRFRTCYVEIGRKNSKTTISAGVALYMGFADGEAGAEVYSAAANHKQARICFDIGRIMTNDSRLTEFRQRFGVEVRAHVICSTNQASFFEAISSETKGLDGKNPHFAVIDEFHAHPSNAVYDALETGMGAREQPLMWVITTAGSNMASPCYSMRSYLTKVLDGAIDDDSLFGLIYTLDSASNLDSSDGDDWTDSECWIKANPNLGVSVFEDEIRQKVDQAKGDPIKQAAVQTKRMNLWISADLRAFDMQAWSTCSDPFEINDLRKHPCTVAFDLSSRDDISALAMVWDRDGDLYVKLRYYLPREMVMEKATTVHSHYAGWAASGLLTLTEGNDVDYSTIERDILDLPKRDFQIEEVCFDPWHATQLQQNLQAAGVPVVQIPQTAKMMSEPEEAMLALTRSGKLHHGGDPILTWMASNVVAHRDANDNIFFRKERPENKIDGVKAVAMAMCRMIRKERPSPSRYEDPSAEVTVIG